jgi:hypothetical protein
VRVLLPGTGREQGPLRLLTSLLAFATFAVLSKVVAEVGGRVDRMKTLLFIPGFLISAFLMLSATSDAAPLGDGPSGHGFRGGFAAHRAGTLFTTSRGIRPNPAFRSNFRLNQDRRFFHRDHQVFFQPSIWPTYWYPYGDLNDYSYLDAEPDETYQYWDSSTAPPQLESSRPVTDRGPIVVIVKAGSPGTPDSSQNSGYGANGYSSTASAGQRNFLSQDQSERGGPSADPSTAVPQTTPAIVKGTQTRPQAENGPFGNFVLVSWLEEAGKDVIYVQNTETHDVQKITSQPNLDNFRIVELRRSTDPKLFEAVISNGSQQGPVRFRF